ncbi:alkaline nuclease [Anopheles darlingi]|uniref:Alkaline nuclease n=1 Tax=Anopheles darlingi TaxID=43151 RepID=W5JDC0_ANODA|nr:alkaline nuclease [Anopheles darlingi]
MARQLVVLLICGAAVLQELFIRGVVSREYIEATTDALEWVLPVSEKKNDGTTDPACSISLHRDLTIMQPLLLKPGSSQFVWPRLNSTTVELDYGQPLELFCSHGFRDGSPVGKAKSAIVTCEGNDELGYAAGSYNISHFTCQRPVYHVAERTGGRCYGDSTLIRIGFELAPDRFVQLYEVCFNELQLHSHYVKYNLSPHNGHHQRAVKRPSFLQGGFYRDLKMNSIYTFVKQHATVQRILGTKARADAVLDSKRGLFLSRGHLAAKSDFIFGSHQRASFWLMNVAPQWQRFNALNWQRIETAVKEYITANDLWLTVYTGTYGVLELLDGNGDPQQIFLDYDAARDPPGRIPIPKLFYKVLIDEQTQSGIALIGVNNPHATPEEIAEQYVVCKDVSSAIDWIHWKRDSIPDGYSYACDVNEFNDVTGHLELVQPIGKLLL